MQKHYGHGLSFLGTYTWAHALDNTNDILGGDYGGYRQSYLIPINHEWGQSGYDIRQRAVDQRRLRPAIRSGQAVRQPARAFWTKSLADGSPTWSGGAQTGQPFTVTISRISGWSNANGGENNTAIKVANAYSNNLQAPANSANPITASGITTGAASNTSANVCAAQTKTRQRWFNPCAFADPLGVSARATRLPFLILRLTKPAHSAITRPQSAPITRLPTAHLTPREDRAASGPVPYVTGLCGRDAVLWQSQEQCFRAGQLEAERVAVQGLQDMARAIPGVPRRRLQRPQPPEPRQPWQQQHEYRRQRSPDNWNRVEPDPHHRRPVLPVVRQIRVLT